MSESDEDFEQQLRDGLRPREAPAGFAERVVALAAAARMESAKVTPVDVSRVRARRLAPSYGASPALRWAIAAVLLLAVGLGSYAERQREIAGERARQQVLLALRITGSTLRAVHNKIQGDE